MNSSVHDNSNGFNLVSILDSNGDAELSVRLHHHYVQLTIVLWEGAEQNRRQVELSFDASLNEDKWHRIAFSFEVCFVLIRYLQ